MEMEREGQQQHRADHEVGGRRQQQLDARHHRPQTPPAVGGEQRRSHRQQHRQHRCAAGQRQGRGSLLADRLANRYAQPVRLAQVTLGQARQVVAVLHPQRLIEAVLGAHLRQQRFARHGIRAAEDRQGSVATAVLHAEEGQAGRRP